MKRWIVGGRSNSGKGAKTRITTARDADTKQFASGLGVTAEYLVSGKEIEIKMAQGAKPGEGGQLMGIKVGDEIAFARKSSPGVDLISPPPLHDIYSIEDLKELVETLRELYPEVRVVVKLVSGLNIGAIAAGVVKAGADIIQISGDPEAQRTINVDDACRFTVGAGSRRRSQNADKLWIALTGNPQGGWGSSYRS